MRNAFVQIIAITCMSFIGVNAQVYKTVHVDTAGTLDSLLSAEELATVTDLLLTGNINTDDFNTMKNLMPALTGIDMSLAQPVGDSIPSNAFKSNIDSLILPLTITALRDRALQGCGALTTLTIPDPVRSIGSHAFEGCGGLTSLIIPDSVTKVSDYTFAGCSGLISLSLPASAGSIGNYALAGCSGLNLLVIPDSVKTIGEYAFVSCSMMDSVSLGSAVDSIGPYAFAGCTSLQSLTVPASVTSLGTYACVGCSALKSVNILSSDKTAIGDYAFAGDAGLSSVTIHPSEGTSIGNYAFVSCTGLKTLDMASPSVTSIGEGCFIGNRIDSLVFPGSLTSIGALAFYGSAQLASLIMPHTLRYIGERAFGDCISINSVTFLSTTEPGTFVGNYAFFGCSNLTSLQMAPYSVTSIGDYCFGGCQELTSLVMPSSLMYIGPYAFASLQGIDSLTFLPSTGCTIGEMAFYNCDSLVSVRMFSPSIDTVGPRGFDDCEHLTDVILPSSLAWMEGAAFGRCYGLQQIRINCLVPPVIPESNNVFNYVSTGAVNLYVPAGTKEAYQVAEVWRKFNIVEYDLNLSVLPDTVTMADTAGSSITFDIASSTNWQIISDQLWITASPVIGMDTTSITLIAEPNTDTIARKAILTVSGVNVVSDTVVVIQAPKPALSISASGLGIGAPEGSIATFNIFSNQEWTVQSDQTWLTTGLSSGKGSAEIMLTAEANPDTLTREAIVTVYTDRLMPRTIVVTQAPLLILSVSSALLSIEAQAGSTVFFHIASNTGWTVLSDQTWLIAHPSSGSGNGEVMLTAEANNDTLAREVTVTVSADGELAQTVIVIQDAAIPSGITDVLQEMIVIYPNPVKDVLNIDGAAGSDMIIFDIRGRIVGSQRLCSYHEIIDMSSMPPGDYVLRMGDSVVKIVK
ncbi:MAG: leucine-rich repeat protein [Bacteroidales bacterium]|nr:leucine-rich repeat protein [Bacteroidales bacterium]